MSRSDMLNDTRLASPRSQQVERVLLGRRPGLLRELGEVPAFNRRIGRVAADHQRVRAAASRDVDR